MWSLLVVLFLATSVLGFTQEAGVFVASDDNVHELINSAEFALVAFCMFIVMMNQYWS